MRRWFAAVVLLLATVTTGRAQDDVLKIAVAGQKQEHWNNPLTIPLSVPKAWAKFDEVAVDVITGRDVVQVVGQLTAPGITTEAIKPAKAGLVRRDLHVVTTARCQELVVHFKETRPQVTRFAWKEKPGEYQELILTRSGTYTRYMRYMNRPFDESSADARNKTYKVFHHLYDPAGKRFVTNGGFADDDIGDPKKLVYPHHRGIMYGFNKCSYGPDLMLQADTWHCPPPAKPNEKKAVATAHVAHLKTLGAETGPLLGRHRVLIGWYGAGDKPFAQEERELTVYHVKGGTLVEFASRLTTTDGKVRVDGDPQHAGFQFRAHNDVAADAEERKDKAKKAKQKKVDPPVPTYYLHPDGKGEMGQERNWPGDKTMVDLPWYAMSFVLDGQRYTTCYLNHPSNPKDTRFSERDYGRFGGYFQRDITEKSPLVVNYRLWLQTGDMTADEAAALRSAFAAPPKCTVK
jgi:hypothetical protein